MMKRFYLILFLFMFSVEVFASPSGKDLLSACETALDKGFHGATGMMCEWYATPCDCHLGKDNDIPRVCLPDGLESEYLAKEIVSGLKLNLELQKKDADFAAGSILVEKYPCD